MRNVAVVMVGLLALGMGERLAGADTNTLTDAGRVVQRATSCGGSASLPGHIDNGLVDKHCKQLSKLVSKYRARWLDKATPFLRRVVPAAVPKTILYPFGGGDLLTALAVFPELREVTTISLEPAGDITSIQRLNARTFAGALAQQRREIEFLLRSSFSRTRHMHVFMTHGKLPGQLVFSLLALSVHGFELVDLRYFTLDAKGGVVYLDAAARKARGKRAFDHVELRFRKAGAAGAPVRVFRHIRQNLADSHITKPPGFLEHLRAKGKITVMTKAASYLLWWRKFSRLRNYLIANMAWMISDSSGMLPRHLRATGFEQVTYGKFEGNILNIAAHLTEEAKRLWKRNRYRRLRFRFGYPDTNGNPSLMITRKRR